MREILKNSVITAVGVGIIVAAVFYLSQSKVKAPVENLPTQEQVTVTLGVNATGLPLKLPDGFKIEFFAKDLSGARVLALDPEGNLWVSRTQSGVVSKLQIADGKVVLQIDELNNLTKPHGLAFRLDEKGIIYVAEEGRVSKILMATEAPPKTIADLPTQGGGHFTRTLAFGPDNRLYISIGSSCNVCNEGDPRRAAIYSMNADGSDFKQFAKGLRNTVFFTWNTDGKMWGTDMGRDYLGDNLPPDEINTISEGKDYGWPNCYGNNVPDPFNPTCENKTPSQIDLQAHSAPLGLAFVPHDSTWPKEYWGDLIVAFHGSWNRSVPTGYKLVRIKLDANGKSEGQEDFITGWHTGSAVLGRPVDVKFHNNDLYVSDDKAGVIYRVNYQQ